MSLIPCTLPDTAFKMNRKFKMPLPKGRIFSSPLKQHGCGSSLMIKNYRKNICEDLFWDCSISSK
jgi:hypothetical protein